MTVDLSVAEVKLILDVLGDKAKEWDAKKEKDVEAGMLAVSLTMKFMSCLQHDLAEAMKKRG